MFNVVRRLVQRVEITAISHATEDFEKVAKALSLTVPSDLRSKIVYETAKSRGHHGNPIVYIRVVLEGEDAEKVLSHIIANMDETSKALLKTTLRERIQGNSILHLRIHKQHLLRGRVILWDGDESIKLVIRFKDRKGMEDALELHGMK